MVRMSFCDHMVPRKYYYITVHFKKFSIYARIYLNYTLSNLALMATTTVLTLINTAPTAGLSITPKLYKTPAAKGNAITL